MLLACLLRREPDACVPSCPPPADRRPSLIISPPATMAALKSDRADRPAPAAPAPAPAPAPRLRVRRPSTSSVMSVLCRARQAFLRLARPGRPRRELTSPLPLCQTYACPLAPLRSDRSALSLAGRSHRSTTSSYSHPPSYASRLSSRARQSSGTTSRSQPSPLEAAASKSSPLGRLIAHSLETGRSGRSTLALSLGLLALVKWLAGVGSHSGPSASPPRTSLPPPPSCV